MSGVLSDQRIHLAAVLGPHFERENEIALPPLGLLAPLAAGEKPGGMEEALAMTDALRKELPDSRRDREAPQRRPRGEGFSVRAVRG